jgi:hypothetical protein
LVEVVDVFGGENSGVGLVAPYGHRFGTWGVFEVSREVMMERRVKKMVELRYLGVGEFNVATSHLGHVTDAMCC